MTPYIILAIAYIVSGGANISEPLEFKSKISFRNLKECQEHLTSPAFGEQREKLTAFLLNQLPETLVGNDGEPVSPGIAITASCQEDKRV